MVWFSLSKTWVALCRNDQSTSTHAYRGRGRRLMPCARSWLGRRGVTLHCGAASSNVFCAGSFDTTAEINAATSNSLSSAARASAFFRARLESAAVNCAASARRNWPSDSVRSLSASQCSASDSSKPASSRKSRTIGGAEVTTSVVWGSRKNATTVLERA